KWREEGRSYFRDFSQPWRKTNVVEFESTNIRVTELGTDVLTGRLRKFDAFNSLFQSHEENGEFPFKILALAFKEANRPLSLDEISKGIMRNFRSGDSIADALQDMDDDFSLTTSQKRKIKTILLLMETAGVLA